MESIKYDIDLSNVLHTNKFGPNNIMIIEMYSWN